MRLFHRPGSVLQSCFLATCAIRGATAALAFTNSFNGLTAGASFDLEWSGASGTSSVTLLSGASSSQVEVNKVACMLITLA